MIKINGDSFFELQKLYKEVGIIDNKVTEESVNSNKILNVDAFNVIIDKKRMLGYLMILEHLEREEEYDEENFSTVFNSMAKLYGEMNMSYEEFKNTGLIKLL